MCSWNAKDALAAIEPQFEESLNALMHWVGLGWVGSQSLKIKNAMQPGWVSL